MELICRLLIIYNFIVIFRIILGMIVEFGRVPWGHPLRRITDLIGKAVDPVLAPIRAVMPPVRTGGFALDLSPIVLLVGLGIIIQIIC